MDLGGAPDDYDIGGETRVLEERLQRRASRTRRPRSGRSSSAASSTATRSPNDLNVMTKASAAGVAGTGLVGVAKDNLPRTGTVPALAAGFIEIELDVETGKFEILDYVGVADCGTVLHPQGLAHQIKSGAVMGIGLAASRAAHLRSAERLARQHRPAAGEAGVVPRRAGDDADGRGSTSPTRRTRSARRASASPSRAVRRPRCSARSPMRSAAITSTARR